MDLYLKNYICLQYYFALISCLFTGAYMAIVMQEQAAAQAFALAAASGKKKK